MAPRYRSCKRCGAGFDNYGSLSADFRGDGGDQATAAGAAVSANYRQGVTNQREVRWRVVPWPREGRMDVKLAAVRSGESGRDGFRQFRFTFTRFSAGLGP